MSHARFPCKLDSVGVPVVNQGDVHGWAVSWNPDDNRFYVHAPDEDSTTRAVFKDWRNVIQYCRTRKPN